MFYDFISKTIISKSLIFIKAISTPKTISKSLIFLVLIIQLLLIKLDFKIYLRRVGAHGRACDPRWRAPACQTPARGGRAHAAALRPGAALTRRDAGGGVGGRRCGGASGRAAALEEPAGH